MSVALAVVNQDWAVTQLVKLVDAERSMAGGTGPNPKTPPHESLSCVYYEMSAADERHAQAIKLSESNQIARQRMPNPIGLRQQTM